MMKETRLLPFLVVPLGVAAGALAVYFVVPGPKSGGTVQVAVPAGGNPAPPAAPVVAPAPVPVQPQAAAPASTQPQAAAPVAAVPTAPADAAATPAEAKPQPQTEAKLEGKPEAGPKSDGKGAGKSEAKPVEEPTPPAFDVVRVEPSGEAVIAGRAAPGVTVELLRDGRQYDRVVADTSGLFAMTPKPLSPGSHDLTLRFTLGTGQQALSKQSVTVVVASNLKDAPVVALAAPGQPTVVLSNPSAEQAALGTQAVRQKPAAASSQEAPKPGAPAQARAAVMIESVETEEGGKLFVTGRAAPGATLRLYLNDAYLASGTSAPEGRLSFTIASGVAAGDYRVRLDDVDAVTGSVKSRAEVPFNVPKPTVLASSTDRPATAPAASVAAGSAVPGASPPSASAERMAASSPVVLVPDVKTALVSRGDSLWRISKRIYGQGVRYTVIYQANQIQIRNPSLIYPGQIFVVPGERL